MKRAITFITTLLSIVVIALAVVPAAQANPDYLLNKATQTCIVGKHTFTLQVQTRVYYDRQFRDPWIESPNAYARAWECGDQNQSKIMQNIAVKFDLIGKGWGLDGCAAGYPPQFTCQISGEDHKLTLDAGGRGDVASHYASYDGNISSIQAGADGRVNSVTMSGWAAFQPHGSTSTHFIDSSATSNND